MGTLLVALAVCAATVSASPAPAGRQAGPPPEVMSIPTPARPGTGLSALPSDARLPKVPVVKPLRLPAIPEPAPRLRPAPPFAVQLPKIAASAFAASGPTSQGVAKVGQALAGELAAPVRERATGLLNRYWQEAPVRTGLAVGGAAALALGALAWHEWQQGGSLAASKTLRLGDIDFRVSGAADWGTGAWSVGVRFSFDRLLDPEPPRPPRTPAPR